MSSLQFPPSSPVLDGPETLGDPFKGREPPQNQVEYPTPNPSSTIGRLSSPARYEAPATGAGYRQVTRPGGNERDTHGLPRKRVHFLAPGPAPRQARAAVGSSPVRLAPAAGSRDFAIVDPRTLVLRVPLLADRTSVSIGRSSRSCDFHFGGAGRPADKSISRCHVTIEYPDEQMVLRCAGYNGLGMIVPRACLVRKLAPNAFELVETSAPLRAQNVGRSVRLDHRHTEFHVARGESVHMPRLSNVLLQIGTHVLLVNPDGCDEELTDEETTEVVPSGAPTGAPTEVVPAKTPQLPQRALAPRVPTLGPTLQVLTPAVATPPSGPHTPRKLVHHSTVSEEPTPSRPKKTAAEKESLSEHSLPSSQVLTAPLSSRSPNIPTAAPWRKRAQSEEPQGSAKKPKRVQEHDVHGRLIIVDQCLEGVTNIGEIENILVNHLAFSRLSSTPASFLNTILAVVAKLTLQQLRVVLHKASCIGVIYRQGKDAAGKPLEEEYYYMPEKDRDPERNRLVSSVRGHGGLRACRKTHKQYYWKKPAPMKK